MSPESIVSPTDHRRSPAAIPTTGVERGVTGARLHREGFGDWYSVSLFLLVGCNAAFYTETIVIGVL